MCTLTHLYSLTYLCMCISHTCILLHVFSCVSHTRVFSHTSVYAYSSCLFHLLCPALELLQSYYSSDHKNLHSLAPSPFHMCPSLIFCTDSKTALIFSNNKSLLQPSEVCANSLGPQEQNVTDGAARSSSNLACFRQTEVQGQGVSMGCVLERILWILLVSGDPCVL